MITNFTQNISEPLLVPSDGFLQDLEQPSLDLQSLQNWGPSKKKPTKPANPASRTFDEYRQKGLDWFEKLIERLQKAENHKEALVVGLGFTFVGLVMTFAGAQFLTVIFSIICSVALAALMTFFLCTVMDVKWDSDAGIGITSVSMMLSAPFVQFALKFADEYAVPSIAGICMAVGAEIACTLMAVKDEPFMVKTVIEFACFLCGFFLAAKYQDYIRVFVTSIFGGFLITTGGTIIFGKFPQTKKEQNLKYLSHFVIMMIISIVGAAYQNKQIRELNAELAKQDLGNQKKKKQNLQMKDGPKGPKDVEREVMKRQQLMQQQQQQQSQQSQGRQGHQQVVSIQNDEPLIQSVEIPSPLAGNNNYGTQLLTTPQDVQSFLSKFD